MSTYKAADLAIFDRLGDNWATTDIAYPNTTYVAAESPYVEAVIRHQGAFNVSVPAQDVRYPGLLVLTVKVPKNTGVGTALTYADSLAALFRNVSIDPRVKFRAPTVRPLGPDKDSWYVVEVVCPFYRDTSH